MNREEIYVSILEATGNIQSNVSLILEAKALEAEKAKNWLCNHFSDAADHQVQLMQVIEIHQQIIAVIVGITKMEYGLGKNLKLILWNNDSGENDGIDGGNGRFVMSGLS